MRERGDGPGWTIEEDWFGCAVGLLILVVINVLTLL